MRKDAKVYLQKLISVFVKIELLKVKPGCRVQETFYIFRLLLVEFPIQMLTPGLLIRND